MDIEILHRPGTAAARFRLQANESLTAESGAMISMSGNIQVSTTTHKKGQGSLLKAAKRLLAGESIFLNHYEAQTAGEVILGTTLVGDMMAHQLQGETLIVQGGSFVACADTVDIDLGWEGFKSFFSGESLFWIHMKGHGPVVTNAFGAIYPIEVDGDVIVDTGHIVAFEETLNFKITKADSSWVSSFLGGEGLVCQFSGQGTVWCQSHNPKEFGQTLGPLLRRRSA